MEVTRTNFQDVITELDDILDKATFLAIDGEFTGLNSGPDASAFDTPAQYYSKLRTGSMDFLLVQFGLSAFTYNKQNKKYSQRSYNFYVFPKPFDRSSPDCRFKCQASSIAFLANQGFDFNKLFKYGIPYLTKGEEDKLNKKMEEKQRVRDEGLDLIPISDDDKPQIEDICDTIDNFINSENKELVIDKCNAFVRRLIHQEVRLRYPDKVRLESKNDSGNPHIIAYKIGSKEEEEKKEVERREREKRELQNAVGLSALLRKIADSGKLIVGHNMLLDLCHIIHQFFGPLPESYIEFKSLVHNLFPKLLDTKIVCQSAQFRDSVPSILNQLFDTLQSPPFSIPKTDDIENRSYGISDDKLHEAGYDAYVTGLCFIALCNRLGSLQTPEVATVLADSALLNPYLNKLLIARLKDYPHINLVGRDPNPSREHVFHVTFPKEWKYSDLTSLFSPYGGAYVSWLSDTSAYAALYQKDQVGAIVKNLFKSKVCTVQRYREHQVSLEKEKTVMIKQERKRKISESRSECKTGCRKGAFKRTSSREQRIALLNRTSVSRVLANESSQAGLEQKFTGVESPTTEEPTKKEGASHNSEAAKGPEDDGWEMASGNDSTKFPEHDDARAPTSDDSAFHVVRKVRLKSPKPSPIASAANHPISSSTRYTILSRLDDDGKLTEGSRGGKRSPRKGPSSPEKKTRRRNLGPGEPHKSDRRHKKVDKSSGGWGWMTWSVKVLPLVGVLAYLYYVTAL